MRLVRKRKLSEQQSRRISKQQKENQNIKDSQLVEGVVVSHFGKQLAVQVKSLPEELPSKPAQVDASTESFWKEIILEDIWRCHTRTNLPLLATGDKVRWRADCNTGLGMIEALHERKSLISRPDRYHKIKPIVANIDIIFIVFSPLPVPSTQLIDRYLVACHHANIKPILVLNKKDLLEQSDNKCLQILGEYDQLGYDTLLTSQDSPLTELEELVKDKVVAFLGQSGVGKSSLINVLCPTAMQKVNVISENSDLGQHTTTATRYIPFVGSGALIDSPGVREYGVWHLTADEIIDGFKEISLLSADCKYRNCSHMNEPHCAVKEAVALGTILKRRYENLLTLQQESREYHS